jgi:hypothetical protein
MNMTGCEMEGATATSHLNETSGPVSTLVLIEFLQDSTVQSKQPEVVPTSKKFQIRPTTLQNTSHGYSSGHTGIAMSLKQLSRILVAASRTVTMFQTCVRKLYTIRQAKKWTELKSFLAVGNMDTKKEENSGVRTEQQSCTDSKLRAQ